MKSIASANARTAAASNTANTIFDGAASAEEREGGHRLPPTRATCGVAANSDGSSAMP